MHKIVTLTLAATITFTPSLSFAGGGPGHGVVGYQDVPRPTEDASQQEVWTYASQGTALGQLNGRDTRLYDDTSWAYDPDYREIYGAFRYQHTCLSTVYAMIEHTIPGGNRSYRIGQPGTWDDEKGAKQLGLSFSATENTTFRPDAVEEQLRGGTPVILHGRSSGGPGGIPDHYLLAVGIDRNGRIIVKDPLSAETFSIDQNSGIIRIPSSQGGTLNYSLASYRSITSR